MKRLKAFLTTLTLALSVVFSIAETPEITPSVHTTWHVDVTTLKGNVKCYNNPDGAPRSGSWQVFAMGRKLNYWALANNLMLAALIGTGIAYALHWNPLVVTFTIYALTTGTQLIAPLFTSSPLGRLGGAGAAFTGVAQEIWAKDITERLFPDNDFMNEARDDNDKLDGLIVHLPQIGGQGRVVKNRTILPATATPRPDTIASYNIDEFTTDPRLIKMSEEEVLSYDKRMSIIEDDMMTLETDTAANLLYSWSPPIGSAGIAVRSTGANRAAYVATQTGTRKTVQLIDFLQLHTLLNYQNVPQANRCILIDPGLQTDLLQIEQITNVLYIGNTGAMQEGFIGRAIGFKFYVRSQASTYDNSGSPILNAVGAAPQATDNLSIMAWHPQFVRKAWGNLANGGLKVFENPEQAIYYGTVLSLMVRSGGRQARSDGKGIVALIEGQ